jgi:hypothetical protein
VKRGVEVLVLMSIVWCAPAFGANPGERTYADPACSARDIDPQKCIIQDGPARFGPHQQAADSGNGSGGGTTSAPAPGSALTGTVIKPGFSAARGRR